MPICDYYTTALLKENTAANQETLLTLVVNTVVIGNYTKPNVGITVPGILAPGTGDYAGVELAPYFTGALNSTNRGGSAGVSINFLDGGAAAPLLKNELPTMSSAQYKLVTHLYGYFGSLLGCSQFGSTYKPYGGSTNMYEVHKFMALDPKEVGYFISQVGMAAASFGVADADVKIVGEALNKAFGYKCSPAAAIPASASPKPQAICIDESCPLAANATCSLYADVIQPTNVTMPTGPSNAPTTSPATGTASPTSSVVPAKGAASVAGVSVAAGIFGLAALLL
ncbi:uncharacterized protein K489DRAFT_312469 [Dissoconium aciculare CBS 342.82]|uniref:Uncharacterized protein n=1 Tax=Dissoconium aciculare CBS 342.82 TaxID=1314786 RepID=A0A6J3MFM8_9PEZI|nr:uncharacterized protein K489DRAFT_312469 [Dissoconium aciculare CBS 342.82]KAF1826780.1 hypothetical protein K489DRAFT_312469 [Dissoconium aciculare CBS 342.82]